MSSFESGVLTYLVNSVWQIPVLVAAGWLAARAVRPLGPAAEHRVWVSVLLAEALLPAISLLPADWLRIALPWRTAGAGGPGQVTVTMGAATVLGGGPLLVNLWVFAAVAYGVVTAWFTLRFLWRWTRLGTLRRESVELSGDAGEPWIGCAKLAGAARVALASSSRISGPVTMGFRRTMILLPPGMIRRASEAERRTILAHEFAHIFRHDFFKNLIYEAFTLPVSYHPLVAFTRERLTASREMVCDRMAAETTGTTQYARSLLRLATALHRGLPVRVPHTLGIFDTKTLERRLMQLTEKRKEISRVRRLLVVAACVALAMATCGSSLALRMHVNGAAAADHKAPAQPKGPVAVRNDIMAGQRISGEMPKYPEEAKKNRIQGKIVLDAVIDREGNVKELTAASGPKQLRQSALDAVRTWKYKPFLLNGNPVEVRTTVNVTYSLGK